MEWHQSIGSTQDYLLAQVNQQVATADSGADVPAFSGLSAHGAAVATDDQRGGHGRIGRAWQSSPGASLAVSILIRPSQLRYPLKQDQYSWLTLVAASAIVQWINRVAPNAGAAIKWPNDILARDGRKLVGILASVTHDATGVVLGCGVNLNFGDKGAPVQTATSLAEWVKDTSTLPMGKQAAQQLHNAVLEGIEQFAQDCALRGTDAGTEVLKDQMSTLGQQVRAELPDGTFLTGTASDLGAGGSLVLQRVESSLGVIEATREVSAGDIIHLRRQR